MNGLEDNCGSSFFFFACGSPGSVDLNLSIKTKMKQVRYDFQVTSERGLVL